MTWTTQALAVGVSNCHWFPLRSRVPSSWRKEGSLGPGVHRMRVHGPSGGKNVAVSGSTMPSIRRAMGRTSHGRGAGRNRRSETVEATRKDGGRHLERPPGVARCCRGHAAATLVYGGRAASREWAWKPADGRRSRKGVRKVPAPSEQGNRCPIPRTGRGAGESPRGGAETTPPCHRVFETQTVTGT